MDYKDILVSQKDVLDMLKEYEMEDFVPVAVRKEPFEKTPIWVYWEQGISNAPEIVRACVNSIEVHRPHDTTELIILDADSLGKYIEIPEFVFKNTADNYTALSNIIRVSLMYCYGGMWIDATYMFTKDMPTDIFTKDFWAAKEIYSMPEGTFLTDFTYNLMYSKPGNEMLRFIYSMLCNYWKHYTSLKHYFLKDGVILYGYQFKKYPKEIIDDLEITNENMYNFNCNRINEYYSPEALAEKEGDNTFCFKLTYKTNILYEEICGKKTFWGYFKDTYLDI